MSEMIEKLSLFFDKIKNVTFLDRVLPWKWNSIKSLSYEAYSEYRQLVDSLTNKSKELEHGRTRIATLEQENEQLKTYNTKFDKELALEKSKATNLNNEIEELSRKISELNTEIARQKESEAGIRKQYEDKITTLHDTQTRIEKERTQEKDDQHKAEIQRITSLKENWARHQETVKERIKAICQKHTIEYIEKPPFKGAPDNTIKICDEYVVFDAKSPGTEDLNNFPQYIRAQTEGVKKYANQEGVKKDVFLVVPSNTLYVIEKFSFNLGAYNVYIISIDALEPIILALKKIEEYEFIKELTPEERENICRIIGKFTHTAKRRIQIDYFFAHQFLEVLTKCESDIPRDMVDKIEAFEKAEKLNPSPDKRTKQIPSQELVKDVGKIKQEMEAKDVVFPTSIAEDIKSLPLYKEDKKEE